MQKVLLDHGARKVSAYTTHGVFPNKSWGKFLHKGGSARKHIRKNVKPWDPDHFWNLMDDWRQKSFVIMLFVLFYFIADNNDGGFSYFWIKDVKGKAPFEILSLAGSIAAALQV